MKICLIVDGLPGFHEEWSGAEQACLCLSEMLKQNGQRIIFMTTKFDKQKRFSDEIHQIPSLFRKTNYLLNQFPIDFISTYFSLRILKKAKPDIIHFHSKLLFFPVMISAKILRIPVVLSVLDHWVICPKETLRISDGELCASLHGAHCVRCFPKSIMLPNSMKRMISHCRSLVFNFSLRKLDRIIAFSEASKNLLIKAGLSDEKIEVIYPYRLSPKSTTSLSFEKLREFTIAFVGWLRRYKGLHVVIQAMSIVIEKIPNARLIVVGSGEESYKNYIKELVENLNLKRHVSFLGKRKNEEVLRLLEGSDVVVVPEQWPNVFGPIVLIEAMTLGRPVVASRIGGIPEFIKDGENGFLVTYNQPRQFAAKIIWLSRHKEAARKLGRNASNSVAFFTSGNSTQKIISLYNYLLKTR